MKWTRSSFEIEGLEHNNPIPMICRIGPFIHSSGINGKNPETGLLSTDIGEQCAQMFLNVRLVLEKTIGRHIYLSGAKNILATREFHSLICKDKWRCQISRLSISRVLPSLAAPSTTSASPDSEPCGGCKSARRRTVR